LLRFNSWRSCCIFQDCRQFGKLYVSVGADSNLLLLKGKAPYFSQEERVYMVNAIRFVEEAFVASGSGMLDFEPDIEELSRFFCS